MPLSYPYSYLEVSQSGLGQRDVLHQEVAVFQGNKWRVQDVNLPGKNYNQKSRLVSSAFLHCNCIFLVPDFVQVLSLAPTTDQKWNKYSDLLLK